MDFTKEEKTHIAREWAESVKTPEIFGGASDRELAAADLISSLPDEWVDADKLQKVIGRWSTEPLTSETAPYMVEQLRELLPAPRTMAEIEWDDAEHHLAEASVAEDDLDGSISDTVIMLGVNRFGNISALDTSTWATWVLSKDALTPTGRRYRPEPEGGVSDGDPLEGSIHTPASFTEGMEAHISDPAEPASQRPEDVPVGEPWQVEVNGKVAIGYRNDPDTRLCWAVVCRDDDSGHHWLYDTDVTLIARLVPETTEQDDEQVFHPDYIYTDRDGDEWEYLDGGWIAGDTHAKRVADRKVCFGYDSLPEGFGPYRKDRLAHESAETVFDPAYAYSDRHGDEWRCEEEEWWCYQQGYRTFRATGTPPADYGPYTRIKKEKNDE